MILYQRFMGPAGFNGSSRWADAKSSMFYYKQYPKVRAILCVSNTCRWEISLFRLTTAQWKSFNAGQLALIPPGCCNASGGRSIDKCEILSSIEPESHAAILKRVQRFERIRKLT